MANCCIEYSVLSKKGNHSGYTLKEAVNSYIEIYPNPNHNKMLNIDYMLKESNDLDITILTLQGKIIWQRQFNHYSGHINSRTIMLPTGTPAGTYIVTFNDGTSITHKKLIIH